MILQTMDWETNLLMNTKKIFSSRLLSKKNKNKIHACIVKCIDTYINQYLILKISMTAANEANVFIGALKFNLLPHRSFQSLAPAYM